MDKKIGEILNHQFNSKPAYQYFFTIAFSVFLIFPLVYYILRMTGEPLYFPLWRDYIFIVVILFFFFHLTLRPHTLIDLKFSDLKKRVHENPAWIFLGLLSVWMIISACVTGFDYDTVIGTAKSHTGLICSLVYNILFVMALCMNREKHIRFFMGLLLAVGFIVSVLILIDYFACGSERVYINKNVFFYNSNHLSYYLLVVSVLAYSVFLLAEKMSIRFASIPVFSVGTAALLLANALGCYIAFAMSLIFSAIVLSLTGKFNWRRYVTVLLVTVLVFLLLILVPNVDHETAKELLLNNLLDFKNCANAVTDLENASDSLGSGRMVLWRAGFRATLDKPIFGNGLSSMRKILLAATNNVNNTVHNEFLEYSSNQGIPALLFYLAFIFSVFIRGAKNRKSLTNRNIVSLCVAFAYLVSSFFGVTMFYTAPYLFIFLAFGYYKPTA